MSFDFVYSSVECLFLLYVPVNVSPSTITMNSSSEEFISLFHMYFIFMACDLREVIARAVHYAGTPGIVISTDNYNPVGLLNDCNTVSRLVRLSATPP